ncbi:hypothetical protein EX30DRAFT_225134 [Ascodesmis nigricans]|uniref:Uncharacterized protein n=1 Tax=Ascodesmis nigricans TaxID=341454 RepID=A0A4S2MJ96_9PEZI|nr:hypothetical protein EX30DRAFT_225134 [Ascodesmis nigricans]
MKSYLSIHQYRSRISRHRPSPELNRVANFRDAPVSNTNTIHSRNIPITPTALLNMDDAFPVHLQPSPRTLAQPT